VNHSAKRRSAVRKYVQETEYLAVCFADRYGGSWSACQHFIQVHYLEKFLEVSVRPSVYFASEITE
jgi:hypothetical protein